MKLTYKKIVLITLCYSLFLGFTSCELEDAINDKETTEPEVILSSENSLATFIIILSDVEYKAEIDTVNNSIQLTLPYGTDLTNLLPTITLPENATISPEPLEALNFESPIVFTITAEDGNTKEYEVTIIAPNDDNTITSLTIENELLEPITGFIDEESKSILLEVPSTLDLTVVKVSFNIPELANALPATESVVDLSNTTTFAITAENGDVAEYTISTYTDNLLENPTGENNGFGWSFDDNTGVETTAEYGNIFYMTAQEDDIFPKIAQDITFPRDYSEKYVMFIGDLTTEKVVENSITRHPYLWAYQVGDFSQDDWIYMQGMSHKADADVWQVVSGAHKLLPNVTGTHFTLSQSIGNGDPFDGTTCKFKDLEVRIFESAEDAAIYVNQIYNQ